MSFGKSRAKRMAPDSPKIGFKDVAGVDEAVEELQEIKEFLENPKKFQALGARIPKGVLLYGPPGTGKTEFADNIAGFLEVPVITLTVSDFLAEGEGRMENRAKLVFDVLSRQSSAVVIFDEMDQFLLDRDSQRFRDQGSAFQFLTPGMLTKFGALRKKASVLFIIATNYEERIDPAIKRTGRIDLQYLLLPPDGAQRLKIINRFVKFDVEALSTNEKAEIVAASAFLGYSDLKRVASDDNAVKDGINGFVDRLDRASRNIQFYSYKDRFAKSNKTVNLSSGPRLELLSLFKLAQDAWGTDAAWIEKAKTFECGRTFVEALVDDLLNVKVSGQSKPGFVNELKKQGIELPK
jgi:SpoVK/Ycf46/Vps4 family AAA+-type ATPase